jgi:MFS family permease
MKLSFNLRINRIIKYLIWSDLVFWTGWGLINPIFAIFIIDKIQGGSAAVAGIASAIYWILKSFLRIPISIFLDACPGERDDFWFLFFGFFLAGLIPFGYIFASITLHIYLLQAIYGLAMAMALSGWSAIFTRHIDKGLEATEWGLDATSVGFGIGLAGAIGGWAVTRFGFNLVFALVGILGILSAFLLLVLEKEMKEVFDHGFHFSFKEIFSKTEKK